MVGFAVRDLDASLAYYAKLGFKPVFQNGAVYAIYSRDGIEISLSLDRTGAKSGKGSCYIKLEGVDALHAELLVKNVVVTHPLKTESYGMREFMLTDLDGNTLNFGEPVKP